MGPVPYSKFPDCHKQTELDNKAVDKGFSVKGKMALKLIIDNFGDLVFHDGWEVCAPPNHRSNCPSPALSAAARAWCGPPSDVFRAPLASRRDCIGLRRASCVLWQGDPEDSDFFDIWNNCDLYRELSDANDDLVAKDLEDASMSLEDGSLSLSDLTQTCPTAPAGRRLEEKTKDARSMDAPVGATNISRLQAALTAMPRPSSANQKASELANADAPRTDRSTPASACADLPDETVAALSKELAGADKARASLGL